MFGPTRPVPASRRFLKTFQSDELRQGRSLLTRRIERELLELLLKWANDSGVQKFSGTKYERERMARSLSSIGQPVSEASVAKALTTLSRRNGSNLLIRLSKGLYRFNPEHFFIGSEFERDKAIEEVISMRAAHDRENRAKKDKTRFAEKLGRDEGCPLRVSAANDEGLAERAAS